MTSIPTGRLPNAWDRGPAIAWAAIPAAVAFLVRLPALGAGWVWDDPQIVRAQLPAFRSLRDLLFPPTGIPEFSTHYYRPLTTASYLLDRYIYEERAWGFHLTSLLVHALVAALVYLLLRSVLASAERAGGETGGETADRFLLGGRRNGPPEGRQAPGTRAIGTTAGGSYGGAGSPSDGPAGASAASQSRQLRKALFHRGKGRRERGESDEGEGSSGDDSVRSVNVAALFGALLFAVHPMHTESVVWVAGRADLFAAACVLVAILALQRRPLGLGAQVGAAVLFAAGCLFKEVAYGLLPLAPLLIGGTSSGRSQAALLPVRERGAVGGQRAARGSALVREMAASSVRRRANGPHDSLPRPSANPERSVQPHGPRLRAAGVWSSVALLSVAAAILLALRMSALGGLGAAAARAGSESSGSFERLGGALAFYLPRAFLPLPERPYVDSVPEGAAAWAGHAAGAVLLAAGMVLLRFPRWRPSGLGLLVLLAFLAPSLAPAVRQVSVTPLAERYVYLPSVGAVLALAGVVASLLSLGDRRARGPRSSGIRALRFGTSGIALRVGTNGILLVFVAILGALSWNRTKVWQDDISIWTSASRGSLSAVPAIHLARAYDEAGRHEEAQTIYERVLATPERLGDTERALATLNLGAALGRSGRYREAADVLEQAVTLAPGNPRAWFNLANALWPLALGGSEGSIADEAAASRSLEAIRRAAELSPNDPRTLLFLGRVEWTMGNRSRAGEAYRRTIELDPAGPSGAEARAHLARSGIDSHP